MSASIGLVFTVTPFVHSSIIEQKDQHTALELEKRYNSCLELIDKTPEKALNEALAFKADLGGIPAEHCEALALAGLGEYGEAAARLQGMAEKLANSRGLPLVRGKALSSSPALVADMWYQAANAWLLANESLRAAEAIDNATTLVPEGSPQENKIRIARARIAASSEDYEIAYQEMKAALSADPQHLHLLLFFASASRQTGRLDEASEAIERYLVHFSQDPLAMLELGHLRELQNREDQARIAFLKVIEWVDDQASTGSVTAQSDLSALAEDARLGLQRMALKSRR